MCLEASELYQFNNPRLSQSSQFWTPLPSIYIYHIQEVILTLTGSLGLFFPWTQLRLGAPPTAHSLDVQLSHQYQCSILFSWTKLRLGVHSDCSLTRCVALTLVLARCHKDQHPSLTTKKVAMTTFYPSDLRWNVQINWWQAASSLTVLDSSHFNVFILKYF